MTPQQQLLEDTVSGLFAKIVDSMVSESPTVELDVAWQQLQQLGIDNLFLTEEEGGFSGTWQDARIVFYYTGRNALGLPICETIIAKKLLLEACVSMPTGPLTIAPGDNLSLERCPTSGEYLISGRLASVPWGRACECVITACSHDGVDYLLALNCDESNYNGGRANEAGEPRDNLDFKQAKVVGMAALDGAPQRLFRAGALMRTAQMAGALDAALQMAVDHVKGREQFGRPLAKFQAIQQQLAILAEECAAVNCAAQAAALAEDFGDSGFEVAAAKLRANRSVGSATSIAHQVHGAIGVTREYLLHRFTQRLWAWRSDFGNDRFWAQNLGRQVLAMKKVGLWAHMTALSDKHIK